MAPPKISFERSTSSLGTSMKAKPLRPRRYQHEFLFMQAVTDYQLDKSFKELQIKGSHEDSSVKERSGTSGNNIDGESLPRTTVKGGDPLTLETPQKPMVDVFNRPVGIVSDERKEGLDYQHAISSDKTYGEIVSFEEEDRIFDEIFERMKLNPPAGRLDLDEPALPNRSVGQLLDDCQADDWMKAWIE